MSPKSESNPTDSNPAAPLVRLVLSVGAIVLVALVIILITIARPSRSAMNARQSGGTDADAPTASSVPPVAAELQHRIPQWIWSSATPADGESAFFRRTLPYERPPKSAVLRFVCDDEAVVFVAGARVAEGDDWRSPVEVDLMSAAGAGAMTVDIHAKNTSGPAGLAAIIDVETADGRRERIVTDRSWLVADDASFRDARRATELGVFGADPWGTVPGMLGLGVERDITVPDGFAVDLVYTVPRRLGSWVSVTADARGRLIASGQTTGLFRVTPADDPAQTVVEPIDLAAGSAQGLLCVDEDLYCVRHAADDDEPGLYRLRDTDGDDRYDEISLLRRIDGGGEHGPHGIVLGPDGALFVVAGNHTALPDLESSALPRRWGEDQLLPRLWDPNGHAVGVMAPGGWVCSTDRDGKSWRLIAAGFRNPYDLAFNADGDLFTFDADMEWDMGAPWYRPTRVNHVVSGADFGWRAGTGKWPPHYPDSLPAVLDIGPGSPTGVLFGTGTSFPARYRQALFLLDWTFGTIHAVHLEPQGASYRGTGESFVTGRPLPVADAVVNPADGAMYFVVGGRNLPSALYRVRWAGATETGARADDDRDDEARTQRRALEAFHHEGASARALESLWADLDHPDRFVRHAARVALEHQPVERWRQRALAEPSAHKRITAIVALARCGEARDANAAVATLAALRWKDLDRTQRLEWLRAWSLCFIRLGRPAPADRADLVRVLADVFPTGDDDIDRELCDLLVFLRSPTVVARTVPLMERGDASPAPPVDTALLARSETYGGVILRMATAPPQRQQVHYALALRNAAHGWTPALRDRYFRWLATARRTSGGHSFDGFLARIREDALAHVPPADRARLAALGTDDDTPPENTPVARGPGRQWTTAAVVGLAREGLGGQKRGRDFENGRRMFAAAQCDQCHRFAGTGRAGGPDLTLLSTRFSLDDLAEAIVEPSRTISDQYEDTEFVLDDNSVVIGRVVERDTARVRVMPNRLDPEGLVDVAADDIVSEGPSTVSPMTPGLLDALGPDEVLDLLAYLLAEGDGRSPLFGDR